MREGGSFVGGEVWQLAGTLELMVCSLSTVGSAVKDVKVGDRVALEVRISSKGVWEPKLTSLASLARRVVQALLELQGWPLQRLLPFLLPKYEWKLIPRSQRCPKMVFAATPPYDGTLQGFYTLPSDLCVRSMLSSAR